jgi:Zn-dependent M28 family amino/carboxypeptidase
MEILNMIIKVAIVLGLIFLTTIGWRPSSKFKMTLSKGERTSSENMRKTVMYLSDELGVRNYVHYDHLEKSALYITNAFEALGYSVQAVEYQVDGQVFKNIIAEKPVGDPEGGILLIGAHYDSCFNPGADDNASGVAGLIELARLLKDIPFKHRLRFAAFVNEEPPFFLTEQMGSRVYLRHALSQREKIKAAVILEMIGYYSEKPFSQKYPFLLGPFYPNAANFILVAGNFPSKGVVRRLTKGFRHSETFPIESIVAPAFVPGITFSDHSSFWQAGIPAVMVTDTAYLRNRHYHAETDLADTLNYAKMAKVVSGLKEAIIYLEGTL